ncbi:hypothetical protein LX99_05059 [Mucilaginibacter oryzae]|uniref:Uncharacterized protein n=1 Tax=Mucilaginibacter oryzae TaxID=468058 RepID=A0A316GR48_9SPHI|nr:hypothetical protein LX99_05059 [Mucilaginibacter oryzae]
MTRYQRQLLILCLVFFLCLTCVLAVKLNTMKERDVTNNEKIAYLKGSIRDNLSFHPKLKVKDPALLREYRVIYRYQDGDCTDCIREGLSNLETSLSSSSLKKLLILSNSPYLPFKQYRSVIEYNSISAIDSVKQPYVCFIDTSGRVLFYLKFPVKNIEYNRELLSLVDSNLTTK